MALTEKMMMSSQIASCKGKSESMVDWIFILNVGRVDNFFSKVGLGKKNRIKVQLCMNNIKNVKVCIYIIHLQLNNDFSFVKIQ